jgi:uncharacterized membrane protein YdjX (TVP38/TMEM64 family)
MAPSLLDNAAMTLAHPTRRRRPALAIALALAMGVLAMWLVASTELIDVVSFRGIALHYATLKAVVEDNLALSLLAYATLYIALALALIPASGVMIVAGGLLFGLNIGFLAALAAALVAASLTYWLARTLFAERLQSANAPGIEKVSANFKRHGLGYMLALRLIPGVPFALANVVPALIGVPFRTYLAATIIGLIPVRLVLSTAGAGLGHVIDAKNTEYAACLAALPPVGAPCPYDLTISAFLTRDVIAALVALALLALIPAARDAITAMRDKAKRRRDREQTTC